ncbi:uncharacterized protein ACBR49_017166 [Aulostomus maculatus]
MDWVRVPPPPIFDVTQPEEWPRWIERFERFRVASGLDSRADEEQVRTLVLALGAAAEDVMGSLHLAAEEVSKYPTVVARLQEHFLVRRNVVLERAKFNRRRQEAGETVDGFITALHRLSEHCGYGDALNEMIRDRFVVGLRDKQLSELLQRDPDLTLETAVTRVRQSEPSTQQRQGAPRSICDAEEAPFEEAAPYEEDCDGATDTGAYTSSYPESPGSGGSEQQDCEDAEQEEDDGGDSQQPPESSAEKGGSPDGELRAPPGKSLKKAYKCEVCLKSFDRPCRLRIHQRNHTGEKPFECPDCDKCFKSKSLLSAHRRSHGGERRFCCHECGKCFIHKQALVEHMRTHSGERPFSCQLCSLRFFAKSHLNRHVLTHTGERRHQCVECGKCFQRKEYLSSHMRTHSGERPFSCIDCGRSYSERGRMLRHLRTHTGDSKRHACSVCGQRVVSANHLQRHMQTHSGEQPHCCPDCGKRFARKDKMREHMRIHTGEKPYQCSQCQQSFRWKAALNTHAKKHQALELEELTD